jgi:hypothetical protein
MVTAKELDFQRAVLAVQRRLMLYGKLSRSEVRLSCITWGDEEFQRLLDAIVAGGIATRETGPRRAEVFRSVVYAK